MSQKKNKYSKYIRSDILNFLKSKEEKTLDEISQKFKLINVPKDNRVVSIRDIENELSNLREELVIGYNKETSRYFRLRE